MDLNSDYDEISSFIQNKNYKQFGIVTEMQYLSKKENIIFTIIDLDDNRHNAEIRYNEKTGQIFPPTINLFNRGMKKGIFIHWGIYSVPAFAPKRKTKSKSGTDNGSEWYLGRMKKPFLYKKSTREYHNLNYGNMSYYDFLPMFEKMSEKWNADKWVDLFVSVGADYVVFTAKHHDGVAMYPSSYGKYHTSRDYVGELERAAKKRGLKFGIYYSLMQWEIGKKGKNFENYVNNVLHPQLKEIVTRYNPDLIWADGDWTNTVEEWKSDQFLNWLYEYNKNIIVNSRWGKNFIDTYKNNLLINSYLVPTDRYTPTEEMTNWEHVNTISNSWGYNKNQTSEDYKTALDIAKLCKSTSHLGGSFMINLGPDPNGEFDQLEKDTISMVDLKNCDLNYNNDNVKAYIKNTQTDTGKTEEEIKMSITDYINHNI